ncbi:MAG: hypothetical protein ABGX16_23910 [Pirellulales bacterium]
MNDRESRIRSIAHISHTFLLRGGQILAWLRQTAQFDHQCMNNTYLAKWLVFLARQGLTTARDEKCEKSGLEPRGQRFSWFLLIFGMGLLSGCTGIFSDHDSLIPWFEGDAILPTRINAIWSNSVLQQPGYSGVRGVGGRLLFYPAQNREPITVEGTLVVYAYDQGKKKSAKPARKYVFPADQLAKHYSKSELGHSYSFWLPWGNTNGPPKQLTLIARFEPSEGAAVLSDPASQHLPGISPELLENPMVIREQLSDSSVDESETIRPAQYVASDDKDQHNSPSRETITIDVPPSFVHGHDKLSVVQQEFLERMKEKKFDQQKLHDGGKRHDQNGALPNRSLNVSQDGAESSADLPPSTDSVQNADKLRPVADPHPTRRRLQAWLSERRPQRKAGPHGGSELNR